MHQPYIEAANTLPIYDECDVLVVGGGAAGHAAAVSAARAGANVIIMERYGYFGGDVTGGYVLLIPTLNWRTHSIIRGVQEEWFTRLDKNAPGSYIGPPLKYVGKDYPYIVDQYRPYEGCVNNRQEPHTPLRSMYIEPTELKLEMDDMILEQKDNIKVLLHAWGTKPIVEDGKCKGVIFESKEGRKAIYARVVIDATGDGDLYGQCTDYHGECGILDLDHRDNQTALVWRVGGANFEPMARMRIEQPKVFMRYIQDLWKVAGYKTIPFSTGRSGVLWFNNWLLDKSCINLDDIRDTEFIVRQSIRPILEYCKETLPEVFKDAYLYDVAPQLGVRLSRRLDGEKYMTYLDFACNTEFDDVIAWTQCGGSEVPVEIPYGCLVPKQIDNLICPGRHISADAEAITPLQLIPQCVQTGQAAGVAAAVACQDGTTAKTVDIKKVQAILCEEQDVPLPRQANTNKALVEELEACNYGRDSERAKKIRAAAGLNW